MNRGKAVKAKYGDKGGVFIPSGWIDPKSEFDEYIDAVVIAVHPKWVTVVFTQGYMHLDPGDILTISAKLWHGEAYHS